MTVVADAKGTEAWALLQRHRVSAIPAVDRARRFVGVVTLLDFVRRGAVPVWLRMWRGATDTVAVVMTSPVRAAAAEAPLAVLVPLTSDGGVHHVPVVDAQRKLVGLVAQSDLIAALFRDTQAPEAAKTA